MCEYVCTAYVVDMQGAIGRGSDDMQYVVIHPNADIVGRVSVCRCVRRIAVVFRIKEQAETVVVDS